MKHILLDENPIVVLPSLVKVLGYTRAIILQQIHWLCNQPKSGKRLEDGNVWVWNTYEQWQSEFFPWLSVAMVRKSIKELESEGYLKSKQPNSGEWDRTKYYRVNGEKISITERLLHAESDTINVLPEYRVDALPEYHIEELPESRIFKGTEMSSEMSSDISETDGSRPIADENTPPYKPSSPKDTTSSAHTELMDFHNFHRGKILDGSSQGSAIKKLLNAGYSVEDCIACYEYQLTETWRQRDVSWRTVVGGAKNIAWWDKQGRPKTEIKNGKRTNTEIGQEYIAYGRELEASYDAQDHQPLSLTSGMDDDAFE